jgi:ribose transport system substrate-binding protein
MNIPFLGCDGLPGTGQNAVRTGILTATVVIPPNAGTAIEAVVSAIQTGQQPAQCIYTSPTSFPPIELLKPRK